MMFAIPRCLVWYLDYEICHNLTLAPIVTCYGGEGIIEYEHTSHPSNIKLDPL
jgi:hypothetical protein